LIKYFKDEKRKKVVTSYLFELLKTNDSRLQERINKIINEIMKNVLFVNHFNGVEAFSVNEKQSRIAKVFFDVTGLYPYSLGLFLGVFRKRGFVPSLQLLQRVSSELGGDLTKLVNAVIVGEKGAQQFTYGRDVLKESVKQDFDDLPLNDLLVLNERGELIGLAFKEKSCLRNIVDIAWYLRVGK